MQVPSLFTIVIARSTFCDEAILCWSRLRLLRKKRSH